MARRPTILVIDDSEMFRELESLFLQRCGRVVTAANGPEGLELARQERPAVVVADLTLPGLDGDAVCAEIKRDPLLRETPVVMIISGKPGDEHARAVKAGANDVLAKPIDRVSLIQAVSRFVRDARVRGLPRVALDTEVRLGQRGELRGTALNLSRGGMFVQSDCTLAPDTEVSLSFSLPGEEHVMSPTAVVVWRRESNGALPQGLGLQFLDLDRESSRCIDSFIYQYAEPPTQRKLAHASRS